MSSGRTGPAVTGLGCICAAGTNPDECLESMLSGRRSPGPPSVFHNDHPTSYPVFEVPGAGHVLFQPDDAHYLRTVRLILAAVRQALADAGLSAEELQDRRVGVCLGTSVSSSLHFLQYYKDVRHGGTGDAEEVHRYFRSNPALAVAEYFGWNGPGQTVVNACSSGTDAVGIAASWLNAGLCDIAVAGGGDELSPVPYYGFIRLMISDEEPCRPFDVSRKGLNLGEGAAVLVMEAEPRKEARIRGRIEGYGSCADGHHMTAPHPQGRGLRRALQEALRIAGCRTRDIGFVNVHGTATPDNDRVEGSVLRDMLPHAALCATKCYTGHTLGAAGAIEAVFTLACLERGIVPGNAGFQAVDPDIGIAPTAEPTDISCSLALSQSLAFGGINSAIIISAY